MNLHDEACSLNGCWIIAARTCLTVFQIQRSAAAHAGGNQHCGLECVVIGAKEGKPVNWRAAFESLYGEPL